MAIRLRKIDSKLIAICAARSVPKDGDVYLSDAEHFALKEKFMRDYNEMFNLNLPEEPEHRHLSEIEESDNKNRYWWDSIYNKTG